MGNSHLWLNSLPDATKKELSDGVNASNITASDLDASPGYHIYLKLYDHVLAAHKPKNGTSKDELLRLDKFRYSELPGRIASRVEDAKDGDPKYGWIELGELEELMKWKLARGTPRPKLQSLVASNPADTVKKVTSNALMLLNSNIREWRKPMKQLCTLKGIGPATASLILSAAHPGNYPFFVDELLAWLRGWKSKSDGKIAYNEKEYGEIVDGVRDVRYRLTKELGRTVGATIVEKVAWVIIKLKTPPIQQEVLGDLSSVSNDKGKSKATKEHGSAPAKTAVANDSKSKAVAEPAKPKAKKPVLEKKPSATALKRKTLQKEVEQTAAGKRPRRK